MPRYFISQLPKTLRIEVEEELNSSDRAYSLNPSKTEEEKSLTENRVASLTDQVSRMKPVLLDVTKSNSDVGTGSRPGQDPSPRNEHVGKKQKSGQKVAETKLTPSGVGPNANWCYSDKHKHVQTGHKPAACGLMHGAHIAGL